MKIDQLLCYDCLTTNHFSECLLLSKICINLVIFFFFLNVIVCLGFFVFFLFFKSSSHDQFPKTISTVTLFLMTEIISLCLCTTIFGEFHIWWRCFEFCEVGSLLAYRNRMSKSAKIKSRIHKAVKQLNNCDEGSHFVPFCSSCIIMICIILFVHK